MVQYVSYITIFQENLDNNQNTIRSSINQFSDNFQEFVQIINQTDLFVFFSILLWGNSILFWLELFKLASESARYFENSVENSNLRY